jgi:hypothetical protein
MVKYKLYVRDQNFNRVAEIDDYSKLEIVLNFNMIGTWQLELPSNSNAAYELIKPQAGIIVLRNGQTLFSGPTKIVNRKWNKSGDKITVSGFDDNIFLQRSLAYPVTSGPPYTAQAYDVRTGKAETIMKAYLNANIGSGAQSNRKINITTDTDLGLGLTVTGRARFQTLMELFGGLALAGGDMGFKVVQSNNALLFTTYIPSDKTSTVIFSPLLGNLIDFEYTLTAPDENYVIAGGTGEGTARIFAEQGDSDSISVYGRMEHFIDSRDVSSTSELLQSVQNELVQMAEQTALSITPIETNAIQFGRDYNLGDKVTVVITQENDSGGQDIIQTIQDVIREVKFTIDKDGEVVSPFVGTPDTLSHNSINIFSKMKKMDKRIKNIERT